MKRKLNGKVSSTTEVASDSSDSSNEYEEKLRELKRQLKQLDDKVHPDYLSCKRSCDHWKKEELQRIKILHEYRLENVSDEYKKEVEACDRDCEAEKRRIQDYLISLCEELKRRLEHDKKNIELTPSGDILDYRPTVTRKLRRRTGTDIPASSSSTFMYWGDLLLCGPGWPLYHNTFKATQTDLNATAELQSPIPNSGVDDFSSNTAAGNETEVVVDSFKQTSQVSNGTTTSIVNALPTTPNSVSNKSNLFGSLGLNLFDGSLLSHLLASINAGGSLNGEYSLSNYPSHPYAYLPGSASGSASTSTSMTGGLLRQPGMLMNTAALNSLAGLGQSTTTSTKKRRQNNNTQSAQLNLLLPENDIYADLTVIYRACSKANVTNCNSSGTVGSGGGARKHTHHHHNQPHNSHTMSSPPHHHTGSSADPQGISSSTTKGQKEPCGTPTSANSPGLTNVGSPNPSYGLDPSTPVRAVVNAQSLSVWIDDGRLYCGQKCFQYGAPVVLEGRDGSSHRFTGTIAAIGAQDIAIRRNSDHGICRITVQQLKQGRYVIWPAKVS